MDKIILCKDESTALELQKLGCKLLNKNNDTYTLINCSNKLNFNEFKDRVILTDKLKF